MGDIKLLFGEKMREATVVALQTVLMFLFMAVGYLLYKTKKITPEGSKTIANVLVYAILPAVIIKSFCKSPTGENMIALGVSALIGFGAIAIAIIVSRLFFANAPLDEFACAFSNVGFFGIPLIQATSLGQDGVFYIASIVAFVNIGQWTYGVMRITEKPLKEVFSPKKLLASPFIIATAVGLILFFSGLGVEIIANSATNKLIYGVIDGLSLANTPLAMLVIGGYLAQTDLKSLFKTKAVYTVSLVRLFVIPAITLLVFWVIPERFFVGMPRWVKRCRLRRTSRQGLFSRGKNCNRIDGFFNNINADIYYAC